MATIKYKDKNGEWKELTILKGDSGVAPIINPDTNTWLVWDNEQGVYVDTGVVAGVGTEDFYASTYWVFNEMASGKKVIAKALTDRRYPTNNDESFMDMADKITNMSYEEGWFAKIGYTDENASALKEMIDYSYELAKGWNPDGSTAKMFGGNKQLVFAPMVDTSQYSSLASMFKGCSVLSTIPQLDTSNVTSMSYMFSDCSALSSIPQLDTSNVTNMSFMFYECSSLSTIPQLDTSNVNAFNSAFSYSSVKRIESLDLRSVTNVACMINTTSLKFALLKNIGKSLKTYNFSDATAWGTGGEENRQSLIDSLITYSYDRASNGMATATINLHAKVKALLTEEEIAQITNKGFTIS